MNGTELRARVIEELGLEHGADASSIRVAVQGGVVTLEGSVPSYAASQLSDRAAKRVPGVECVINELSLAPAETRSPRAGDGR